MRPLLGFITLYTVMVTVVWALANHGAVAAVLLLAAVAVIWWLTRGRSAPGTVRAQREPNLAQEIRVAGWDSWAAEHRLRVLDIAPDPGHPGADITLFEVIEGRWRGARLIQVIDASPNADGVHERHALPVPASCRTALAAIAATWGIPAYAYHPERHT
jgi:hypothetical protein